MAEIHLTSLKLNKLFGHLQQGLLSTDHVPALNMLEHMFEFGFHLDGQWLVKEWVNQLDLRVYEAT